MAMVSMIGGTFGLFTGFSILSGIEILYFLLKTSLKLFPKKIKMFKADLA